MNDQYGSPLPLAAVARSAEPTLVWALSSHTVRVHIAWSNRDRTLCDLLVSETREMIQPSWFCKACESGAREIR